MSGCSHCSRCSHCGKQSAAVKRCARCKQASYCGSECQKTAWKGHKQTCATLNEVFAKFHAAMTATPTDWRGVIKWEGRMEELMENQKDAICNRILAGFVDAHMMGVNSTGNADHALSVVSLNERRIELLGKMQRFRDQGTALCTVAQHLQFLDRPQEAVRHFQRAKKIAEAHGFFSVECESCLGLGKLRTVEGRHEEGVGLLRNALAAAPLCESDCSCAACSDHGNIELRVLSAFTCALLDTHAIDEAEPLIPRYRELAKAESVKDGRLSTSELHSLFTSARLYEARGKPHEAEREVRAMLDLVQDNVAAILDEELGVKELGLSVAVELVKLRLGLGDTELIQSMQEAMAVELANMRLG
ncbi:hypothetical protein T484DRAFT_1895394 [Baffinella frigidus]|nr:hypothetical protein T484DRAFT_1895394 [Cryptophyta sp. CCMP2293]